MLTEQKANFIANYEMIAQQNELYRLGKTSFQAGLNQYSDLSFKDMMRFRGGFIPDRYSFESRRKFIS